MHCQGEVERTGSAADGAARSEVRPPIARGLGGVRVQMAYNEGLANRIRDAFERQRQVPEKRMAGGLTFMLRGHMCCGVMKTLPIKNEARK